VPFFWSQHYDVLINFVGNAGSRASLARRPDHVECKVDQRLALVVGSYNAASAVIAARRRAVNVAATAGSALSKGINAEQRSWKRTSRRETICSIR